MRKKIKLLILILLFSFSSLYATYPKVAVVLSGGGARGFAHVGVVEGLMELGIPIDAIYGTSMGGLIGAYYSIGYTSNEIIEMLEDEPLISYLISNQNSYKVTPPSLFKDSDGLKVSVGINPKGVGDLPGLIPDQGILNYLNTTTIKAPGEISFDDLYIPFKALAVNAANGDLKILDHGFVSDAMRATMSIPIVFPPYILKDGTYCMDGGLVDNLPVQLAIQDGADIVISVDVSSKNLKEEGDFSTLSGVVIQTINLVTFSNRKESHNDSDYLIEPDVSDYMVLDINKLDEILDKGFEAFEENKDQFIALRDEIKKYRPLKYVDDDTVGYYQTLKYPLIDSVEFVNVSNINSYSFKNIFDKYIGKRLDEKSLEDLEEAVNSFGVLNSIASVTFNFKQTNIENNEGVLEIGLRDWINSPSKIDVISLVKLGFSSNENNRAWSYLSFEANSNLKKLLADKITADLKLNISENATFNAKIGYQMMDDTTYDMNLFSQFGITVGSLSPANNHYVKYFIPTFSLGFDVGIGFDFILSNQLSLETLANYSLISLGNNPYYIDSNIIAFENSSLNIFNFDLSFAYLDAEDTIFSSSGYGVNGIFSLSFTDGDLGVFGYLYSNGSFPITKNDVIKLGGKFGFSSANYQLTSSYFDLGGYQQIPGFYFGSYTREFFSAELSYQRYLFDYIFPLYLQVGMKFYGYDDYNPIDYIYPKSGSAVGEYLFLGSPSNKIPSITDYGFGIFGAIGMESNFGDVVFGCGFSINGNFNIVLEFV